jgi:hypothetical protein
MTYFRDLTPYTYTQGDETINVGWLSAGEELIIGETSPEFQNKLFQFCKDENIVKVMRGFQECEFCRLSWTEWGKSHPMYGDDAKWMSIGNGEIRVIGNNVIYAAPALIYHYVAEHHYQPPQEFINAVLFGPQPGSPEQLALLEKYGL